MQLTTNATYKMRKNIQTTLLLLFFFTSLDMMAQSIKGKVVDTQGAPLNWRTFVCSQKPTLRLLAVQQAKLMEYLPLKQKVLMAF